MFHPCQKNILPPFMLREAVITINEVPKIHVSSPTEENHSVMFQETNFRIALSLYGTFSYFPTSKPSTKDLEEPDDVYVLTPTTWNPHSDAYVINEESMLDWEGHMGNARDHEKRVVLEDIPSDETMISSLALCEKEEKIISSNFVDDQDDQDVDTSTVQGFEDEMQLYQAMKLRTEHGQLAMNIGATKILDQAYLDDNDESHASNDTDENSMDDPEAESELMDLEEEDLDNLMASTAQVGKPRGVDSRHLTKTWRISHEDAKNTIDVTIQASI